MLREYVEKSPNNRVTELIRERMVLLYDPRELSRLHTYISDGTGFK